MRTFNRLILVFLLFCLTFISLLALESCVPIQEEERESEVISVIENLYCGTGGLTIGPDGNVYLSDFGPILSGVRAFNPSNRVYRYFPEIEVVEVLVEGIEGASGSTFDQDGNFYQSNIRRHVVSKVSHLEGLPQVDTIFVDSVWAPVGLEFDKEGNLYVNNCGTNSISKVSSSGKRTTFCRDTLLKCPNGLSKDEDGNLYAANFSDGRLIKITPDGKASLHATIPGNNNGHVVFHEGFLYVIARAAHQIYRVSLDGEVELFAGNGERGRVNASRLNSSFSFPNDLDITADGKYMYVNETADTVSDHRVLTPTSVRRIKMP